MSAPAATPDTSSRTHLGDWVKRQADRGAVRAELRNAGQAVWDWDFAPTTDPEAIARDVDVRRSGDFRESGATEPVRYELVAMTDSGAIIASIARTLSPPQRTAPETERGAEEPNARGLLELTMEHLRTMRDQEIKREDRADAVFAAAVAFQQQALQIATAKIADLEARGERLAEEHRRALSAAIGDRDSEREHEHRMAALAVKSDGRDRLFTEGGNAVKGIVAAVAGAKSGFGAGIASIVASLSEADRAGIAQVIGPERAAVLQDLAEAVAKSQQGAEAPTGGTV